jgi:hypothetical protein
MQKKDIKKMFPHLYEELNSGDVKVPIEGIRKNVAEAEADNCDCSDEYVQKDAEELSRTEMSDKLRHFNPQAVDFLRRCDTKAQAEEIVAYLEKKGEITKEYAADLRAQMKKDGIRSFGPKKEENHYFKEAGLY